MNPTKVILREGERYKCWLLFRFQSIASLNVELVPTNHVCENCLHLKIHFQNHLPLLQAIEEVNSLILGCIFTDALQGALLGLIMIAIPQQHPPELTTLLVLPLRRAHSSMKPPNFQYVFQGKLKFFLQKFPITHPFGWHPIGQIHSPIIIVDTNLW